MLQRDKSQERTQAIRPVYTNSETPVSPLPPSSEPSEILHVTIHLDPSGQDIVLWEDILVAFKDAVNIRHGTRIISFLKDASFITLEPLRIVAMPDTVLDVHIEGHSTRTDASAAFQSDLPPTYEAATVPSTPPQIPAQSSQSNTTTQLLSTPSTVITSPTPQALSEITEIIAKADRGDTAAQVNLGAAYKTGTHGLSRDYTLAMKWFLKAAETKGESSAIAQSNIASLHENGQGVPRDTSQALAWYLKAAEQGRVLSQLKVGELCTFDMGVKVDFAEALKWFLRAAEQGHSEAQYKAALLYNNGQGVPRDISKAMYWYDKAARRGHTMAVDSLAFLKSRGYTVPAAK